MAATNRPTVNVGARQDFMHYHAEAAQLDILMMTQPIVLEIRRTVRSQLVATVHSD